MSSLTFWLCLVLALVLVLVSVHGLDDTVAYVDIDGGGGDDDTELVEYIDYEKKVLRARAYVDILAAKSPSTPTPGSLTYGSIYVDSLSLAVPNLYEPSNSVPIYYHDERFGWMKPFEFFECNAY